MGADPSNWSMAKEALRKWREVQLVCPTHCGAMNRPGALLIDLLPDGSAECRGCAHAWTPDFSKA